MESLADKLAHPNEIEHGGKQQWFKTRARFKYLQIVYNKQGAILQKKLKKSKSFYKCHILPCQEDTFGAWSRMLKLIGGIVQRIWWRAKCKMWLPRSLSKILRLFAFAFACYIKKTPKKNLKNRCVPSMSILFLVEKSWLMRDTVCGIFQIGFQPTLLWPEHFHITQTSQGSIWTITDS